MAKKITDNTPIQNFEDPWSGVYPSGDPNAGKEWGKTHAEVERIIKKKVAEIDDNIKGHLANLPIVHDLGQDNTKAISQKGITDILRGDGEIIISSSSLESHNCSIGNGSWYRNGTGPQAHCVYPVVEGQKIELQAVSTAGSFYAFLTSSYNPATTYSNGNSLPLVSGTSRMSAPNTTFREIEIPTGCAYLALNLVDGAGISVSWNIRIPTLLTKLKERADETDEELVTIKESIVDVSSMDNEPISSSSLIVRDCSLGDSKWYKSGSGSQSHVAIPVNAGQIFKITAEGAGSCYGFLTSSYNPPYSNDQTIPYVSGTTRIWVSPQTFDLEIPEGCSWLVLTLIDGSGNSTSWSIKYIESVKERIKKIESDVNSLDNAVKKEFVLDTSNYAIVDWFIQNTTPPKWGTGTGKWQCKLIEIDKYRGAELTITKNSNGITYYAFLTSTTRSNNSSPYFCNGETKITVNASNSPLKVTIPNDANYLYIYVNYNGVDVTPTLTIRQNLADTFNETLFVPSSEIDISKLEIQDCSLGTSTWYLSSSGSTKGLQCHVAFPVTAGETIRLRGTENAGWYYGLLTSSYAPPYTDGSAIPYITGETRRTASFKGEILTIPEGCAYIALTMVDGAGAKVDYKVERGIEKPIPKDATRSVPVKLRIAHWNLGHFALGDGYDTVITHENYDAMYQKWAEKINEINADIFMCCEFCPNFVNKDETHQFIRARYSIFKPYANAYIGSRPALNSYMQTAIFSNMELSSIRQSTYTNTIQAGRYYQSADLYIGDTLVKIVETHLDFNQNSNGQAYRTEQIQKLITDFANYTHVIIGGDFNVNSISEYDAFANAGYSMLNNGYLGKINTYPSGAPTAGLDNILCKGFSIGGIHIVDDNTLTDHCAVYADFTLIR